MTQRIGFIGLGIMGQAMAANILKHGYPLTVWNRSPGKCEALCAAGAKLAASPAELTDASDVVILMLTGPEVVDDVLQGETGVLAGDCKGKTLIDMSTVPPASSIKWAESLAGHDMSMLDAPVSGSKLPAEQGTLVILAGGDEASIATNESLLLSMGKQVVRCGPVGSGSSMKLAINLLLGTMMAGLAEATHLAERSGLQTETLLEAVAAGPLACTLFRIKEDMLKNGEYPPQFPFRHMAKDMRFVLDAAGKTGACLPVAECLAGLYAPDADPALLDMDFAAIKSVLERRAG